MKKFKKKSSKGRKQSSEAPIFGFGVKWGSRLAFYYSLCIENARFTALFERISGAILNEMSAMAEVEAFKFGFRLAKAILLEITQ